MKDNTRLWTLVQWASYLGLILIGHCIHSLLCFVEIQGSQEVSSTKPTPRSQAGFDRTGAVHRFGRGDVVFFVWRLSSTPILLDWTLATGTGNIEIGPSIVVRRLVHWKRHVYSYSLDRILNLRKYENMRRSDPSFGLSRKLVTAHHYVVLHSLPKNDS